MNMVKKCISGLLVLSMTLTMSAACQKNNPVSETESAEQEMSGINEQQTTEETEHLRGDTDTLLLVENKTTEYVIVRGRNAEPAEVNAALELQKYLQNITGVRLQIVIDSVSEPTDCEIIIGKTNREAEGEFDREELGDDGFVIKTIGQKLWLVGGGTRGTLYSVYAFLEEYLGCRFYTADCEKIPEMNTIEISPIEENKQIPVFLYRSTDWVPSTYNNFQTKLRLNGAYHSGDEMQGGRIEGSILHSMNELLPASVYYEEHPEYYSGSEALIGQGQLCLSNPEVLRIVTEAVRRKLTDNPEIVLMPISQNDNFNNCTCDDCNRILEEEEGHQSGVVLRFVNAVATELKDEFPDVMFNTFAYQYTRVAPTVTKPADNVTIVLCTIESCFNHPQRENVARGCTSSQSGWKPTISDDLPAWSAISDSILIWDYMTNYSNYNTYFFNFDVMLDNVRFYADNHVLGVYEEGNYQSDSADFPELRAYITSKILWDPYMTEEEYYAHIDDFLEGYYGPGWTYIREYIDMAEEVTKDSCLAIYHCPHDVEYFFSFDTKEVNPRGSYPEELTEDMMRNYRDVDWTQYWNWYVDLSERGTYLETAAQYFENAMQAAEWEIQKNRIDKASLQVEYIESYYMFVKYRVGRAPFNNMLSYYFDANEGLFTKEEGSALRKEIFNFAQTQVLEVYADFNRTLWERLRSHGVDRRSEGTMDPEDPAAYDFTKTPNNWIQ